MLDDLLAYLEEVEEGQCDGRHRPKMKAGEYVIVCLIFIDVGLPEGLFGALERCLRIAWPIPCRIRRWLIR